MEWLKALIEKHTSEGKTDTEAVMNAIKEEFPKHAVTKSAYNEQAEKLKVANSTLDTLKKSNKDNENLQEELKSYKNKVANLEEQARVTALKQSVKDALIGAKGTDVDYLMFKLGDLETDEEGRVKDLDNKIKDLQTTHPTFFALDKPDATNGFERLGGADLPKGNMPSQKDIASVIADKSVNLTDFLKNQKEN